MRPTDLKPPVSREKRSVLIHDRVWYVPQVPLSSNEFLFPGWSHPDLFGNDNPIHIEYCSGNGVWIAEKAIANPFVNWVAVERKFDRVRKIWAKIKNFNLTNMIVMCGEGYQATKRYIPNQSVGEISINFPDPWPKARHAKHRLIQSEFIQEMGRIIAPQGTLMFVTDDKLHSQWFIKKVATHPGFTSVYPDPYYTTDLNAYGSSFFDELWRSQGRSIYYHKFMRS